MSWPAQRQAAWCEQSPHHHSSSTDGCVYFAMGFKAIVHGIWHRGLVHHRLSLCKSSLAPTLEVHQRPSFLGCCVVRPKKIIGATVDNVTWTAHHYSASQRMPWLHHFGPGLPGCPPLQRLACRSLLGRQHSGTARDCLGLPAPPAPCSPQCTIDSIRLRALSAPFTRLEPYSSRSMSHMCCTPHRQFGAFSLAAGGVHLRMVAGLGIPAARGRAQTVERARAQTGAETCWRRLGQAQLPARAPLLSRHVSQASVPRNCTTSPACWHHERKTSLIFPAVCNLCRTGAPSFSL